MSSMSACAMTLSFVSDIRTSTYAENVVVSSRDRHADQRRHLRDPRAAADGSVSCDPHSLVEPHFKLPLLSWLPPSPRTATSASPVVAIVTTSVR
jgi:hypothetical protein